MKAIVAEVDGKSMILITKSGEFVKVKRNIACAIGDEVDYEAPAAVPAFRRLSLIAASFLICAVLGGSIFTYAAPYSYLSLDINPSVSMTLNRFERIIDVKAVNQDGQTVLGDISNLKNKNVDIAVSELLKSAEENGYIKPGVENAVMFVISTNNPAEEAKLQKIVKETSQKSATASKEALNVIVEKTTVSKHKDALTKKTSPGKVLIAERIKQIDPAVKSTDVENLSVQQAMDMIKTMEASRKEKKDMPHSNGLGQLKKEEKQAAKDIKIVDKQIKKATKEQHKEAKKDHKKIDKVSSGKQDKNDSAIVSPSPSPTPDLKKDTHAEKGKKDKKDKKDKGDHGHSKYKKVGNEGPLPSPTPAGDTNQ